jgi:hypothetical protein
MQNDRPQHDARERHERATQAPKPSKKKKAEALREQSRTETEENPYLDTEGGE